MTQLPFNVTERLFMQEAAARLPLASAVIDRNAYGVLFYQWGSPCEAIEALWVSVTRREIVLSCQISHKHISRSSYSRKEKISNLDLKRRIVRDAIQETSRFLDGKIAATISYNADGSQHSSGWCKRDALPSAVAHSKQVFGPEITKRAWVWSGEVSVTTPDIYLTDAPSNRRDE